MRSKDSFDIVIADFGLSKLLNPEKVDSLLKTTVYILLYTSK